MRLEVLFAMLSRFAFWPRIALSFAYEYDKLTFDDLFETASTTRIALGAFAPLDIELASHLFVGLGPSIDRDLTSSTTVSETRYFSVPDRSVQNRATRLGAGLEIGAWL